jgi:FHA domain-containing protein/uncharacterized protein DUF4388
MRVAKYAGRVNAGEDQLRYSLRFLSGKCQGTEYVLADPMEIVVGRSSDADLILIEGMVSRRHARFSLKNGELAVEDLRSTNGTFVNGEKIRRRKLTEGDRVLVGTSIVKVVFSRAPYGTKPPPPPFDALDEDATASRYRVSGDLEEVSVAELLEMFSSPDREAIIELAGPEGGAAITVARGRVQDCVLEKLPEMPPAKAMLRVLGWGRGNFSVAPYEPPSDRRLDLPVPELLVDGLFKLDELEVLRQQLPQRGVRIGVARPLAAPLSALDEADLEMLQLAHNLGDVGTVLDHCPDTDLEAAKRLLGLFDGGYLRRA